MRDLRLAALGADRLAFGSTLERETTYPESRWQEWASRGATGGTEATFAAVDASGAWIGMTGVFSDHGVPHLWGMWVTPKWRRRGVATQLLRTALEWARVRTPAAAVELDVNPTQADAVRLYLAHGFEFTGAEQPLGHDPPAVARQMRKAGAE